ncbi:TAXI family TRAP transporter solute-binding subunit [Brucella abortus]|nr:TAXI family TRAP transporter solute-binding subunit [Brucella abortus]
MREEDWYYEIRKQIRRLAVAAVAGAIALGASFAVAQAPTFFRIGTGGTAGTYYPIGGLIANAISGAGETGVPSSSRRPFRRMARLANINAIKSGALESGFTQSDVALLGL